MLYLVCVYIVYTSSPIHLMSSTSSYSRRSRSRSQADDSDSRHSVLDLLERFDVSARLEGSVEMERLRLLMLSDCDSTYKRVFDTIGVAKALGGYLPVRYYMTDNQEGFGRMKCEVLVEGISAIPYVHMKREIRAHLASEYYWDVDMVNCQPSLFKQLLDSADIPCPLLEKYVLHRDECLNEVMAMCGVTRDQAKNLLIRLIYFGSIESWQAEVGLLGQRLCIVDAQASSNSSSSSSSHVMNMPPWVIALQNEVKHTAQCLLSRPEHDGLKRYYMRRSAVDSLGPGEGSGSMLALLLQTSERECVRALVYAVKTDERTVGSIIYDGVHVEKLPGEQMIPRSSLERWRKAVLVKTDHDVELCVKSFVCDDAWVCKDTSEDTSKWDERWMNGYNLWSYAEMKMLWEKRSFKVVHGGNYIREEREKRVVMTDRVLCDSYKHMHYAVVDKKQRASASLLTSVEFKPFISRWVKDPLIRRFKSQEFKPPPMKSSEEAYNIWNGFAVTRYTPGDKVVDANSEAVQKLLEFCSILCRRDEVLTSYFLDWTAQIFQQPSIKSGVAPLMKGEEGIGKNRWTDLISLMLGVDKSLNTASPKSTLYGEFTQLREGKFLIVINEANGSDNFSANDLIKDMITSDTFVCNSKNIHSYSIECYARFIFTTNNDNCMKMESGSRRFWVIDASSELKGNTEYFKDISSVIADPHSRFELYQNLLSRDISNRDWINDRPLTESFSDMVSQNLAYEHHFVKELVLSSPPETVINIQLDELFGRFKEWLDVNASTSLRDRYNMTTIKFGQKMTKLVAAPTNTAGFKGVLKKRTRDGVRYIIDVDIVRSEMVSKHWISLEDAMVAHVDFCEMK